jgi:hypothetical protein
MTKRKNNYVPTKNYVIAILISLAAIFLTYYVFGWYNVVQEKKYNESYLIKSNTISLEVNDIKEIENAFTEAPSEYFIYIGYHDDENVYKLEKSLKKVIDKYDLNDIFYYIDVTDMKNSDNYIEELNNALGLTDNKIVNIPTIIYVRDGVVLSDGIITREDDNLITAGDLEKLLEMYEFEKVSR